MSITAVAEYIPYELVEAVEQQLPEILVVPEMIADELTRYRAARFIGAAVMGSSKSVEICAVQEPIESLYEAIHRAKAGDPIARKLVETNVRTDVIERTIKTGHVMSKVPLIISEDGKIMQHGQTMDSIQANSLRFAADHPIMRERTEAETRNAFRIEQLNRDGFFEDYSFVVISRAENLPEAGFFTDTMSCSIQVTGKHDRGLATESAFVSGIKVPDTTQHDENTVVKLGSVFGVDLAGKTASEVIDTPLLVHNDLIPNGVINIVQLYDDCAGGTFFGESKPPENYLHYLQTCYQREKTFQPKIEQIIKELLSEAPNINSPILAVERLHKLSEKHMVEQAVIDTRIDARVFGDVAANYIEQARWYVEQGYGDQAVVYVQKAQATAKSSSCPSALRSHEEPDSDNTDQKSSQEEEDGDCEFISKECPVCRAKNVKTRVTKSGRNKKHIKGSCGCSKTVY